MAVDPAWLQRVRQANRERFGMAGMSGMGQAAGSELVAALTRSKQARVAEQIALHPAPPPPPGSTESVLRALPPLEVPQATQIPKSVIYIGGALAVGLVLVIGFSLLRRE